MASQSLAPCISAYLPDFEKGILVPSWLKKSVVVLNSNSGQDLHVDCGNCVSLSFPWQGSADNVLQRHDM